MSRKHPFIGRADILTLLHERYFKARCGDGGAIVLRGDPGIGKTRLLDEFRARVAADDPHVVVTAALDYAPSPFAPIVSVIETWQEKRPALFDVRVGLRDAVDTIVRSDSSGTPPSAGERRRCFDSVARLFRIAAADAPTTLLVDDFHYADPATLQLLYHIVVATERSAFLLLATTRSAPQASLEIRTELARWNRLPNVATIDVGALALAEIESLVRNASENRVGRDTRDRIRDRAEGNPLFAEELVRQSIAGDLDTNRSVPISVADSVLERLSHIPPAQRKTLDLASAFGREFRASMTIATLRREPAEIHATLRTAVTLGLVDETADPDVFRFRHALTCEAIYGELLELQRRELHALIAGELRHVAPTGDAIVALAFHTHAAGEREASAHFNELAGDRASSSQAFEAATAHYARAMSVCGDADVARIGTKLASAYLASGFPDRAAEPARRALEALRVEGSIEGIANAQLLLAEIAGQAGDDEGRLAMLEQTFAVLVDARTPSLISKRTLCATELALADRDLDRVITTTGDSNASDLDVSTSIALSNARAHAMLMLRRYNDAIGAQTQAVRIATESGNLEYVSASRMGLGIVCCLAGQLERAGDEFRLAAEISEERLASTDRALSITFQAETELMRGKTASARTLMGDALAYARRSDHQGLIVMAGRTALWVGMRQDDSDFVGRVVDELDLERLFRDRTPERCFPLSGAFAQYLVSRDRMDEARDILKRAVSRVKNHRRLRSTDWSVCTLLTVAEMGDEADLASARRPFEEWYAPFAPAFLHLFDATAQRRRGNAAQSERSAQLASEILDRYDFQFERMLAYLLAGRKTEALTIAETCGFRDFTRKLRDDLTPKNRQGRPEGALTQREREIAELVGDGLTNRGIAERLFLSEKTVETHLASIFNKLGTRTRTDVAARLAEASATA